MKKHKYSILFGIVLTAFTIYLSLQTFVISEAYQTDATEMNMDLFKTITADKGSTQNTQASDSPAEETSLTGTDSTADAADAAAESSKNSSQKARPGKKRDSSGQSSGQSSGSENEVLTETGITDNTYTDENISITIDEYEVNGTQVYVADVTLSSAEYLKTAFAEDTYGRNVTAATSDIAADHTAILAINGDNYGSRESGYVIRNGIVYRSESNGEDVLCIYADGSMQIIDSDAYTAEELAAQGVWQAFSFGPALVENGEIQVSSEDEVGKAKASNPRTAIGIIDECHYVLVVSDGRTDESEGLSLLELASFMQDLGVTCAYNLDGGGSSTMVFQGQVVNNPTSNGTIRERDVNDIIYVS